MKIISEFKTRSSFIFFIFLAIYSILAINLYLIQVWNNQKFINLAKKQYQVTVTNYPPRGLIKDRSGKILAFNKEKLSAFVLPKQIESPEKTFAFLKEHFPAAYVRLKQSNNKHFIFVKRKLNNKEIELIKNSGIVDLKFIKENSRFYTSNCLGPIIGITDIDNNGQFGIEAIFNKQLAGEPTTLALEMDARSGHFYFGKSTTEEGIEPKDIQLTIDKDLQFLAYEELKDTVKEVGAKEGFVIIIDPSNGHILSMVQYPSFQPNNVTQLELEKTKNKITTDAYEFGSVMKTFVALAALEEGVINLDDIIDCEDSLFGKINGMKFSTWKAQGKIPFSEVFEKSNNIGMAKVAQKLGPILYDYYVRLGFGKKTGLELLGEQAGYITPPDKWSKRSLISLSFGYEIRATLLQLANAMSIIANDGYLVKTKLLYSKEKDSKEKLFSQKSIKQIKELLHNTVQRGTAFKASINGYNVMGKTGTANLLVNNQYSPTKNIYTFAGILEMDEYKRVIVVSIKESNKEQTFASTIAVPLFEKVAEKALIHDKMIHNLH